MRDQQALAPVEPEQVRIPSSSSAGASTRVTDLLPSTFSSLPVQRTTTWREPNLVQARRDARLRGEPEVGRSLPRPDHLGPGFWSSRLPFHEFPGTAALRGAEESIFSTFISERRVRPRNLCGLADCVVRTAVSQQELGIGVNSKLCLLEERETMPSLSLCSTEGGTDHELRRIF